MPDQTLPSATDEIPTDVTGPYVVEHYGFTAPSGAASGNLPRPRTVSGPRRSAGRVPRPAGDRRRRILAAGVLGLVLASGIGGVAAAATGTGIDGRGHGGRGGVSIVGDRVANVPGAGFDGQTGPR